MSHRYPVLIHKFVPDFYDVFSGFAGIAAGVFTLYSTVAEIEFSTYFFTLKSQLAKIIFIIYLAICRTVLYTCVATVHKTARLLQNVDPSFKFIGQFLARL